MLRSKRPTVKDDDGMSDSAAAADEVELSAEDGVEEEIKEERGNAYVEHFVHIVQSTKELFPTLLTHDEHAAIDTFLALPPAAQLVYSRLFQRKGPWFRSSSLAAIAERLDSDPDASEPPIQAALRTLESASFIRCCRKDSYLDALDAMKSACTIPEIQLVMVATGASKTKSDARNKTKADMLARLKSFVTTQRRIDGSFLPLAKHLHAVMTPSSPCGLGTPHSPLTLFQIHPDTRDAFFRMHRLMYVTLSLPPNQRPAKFAAWGDWQRSATQYEPTAWPGLLVTFGKLASFHPVEFSRTCTIFPTMAALVAFECAAMLRHAMTLVVEGIDLDDLVPPTQAGLSVEWLDVGPPSLRAFASADQDQPDKLDCYASVHTFLRSVQNLDDLVREIRSSLAKTTQSAGLHRRVFLEPYHATAGLARCLDKAIGLYEKLGQYDKALILLQELLATQVLRHKRGSWYTRLAINLELHMKQPHEARAVCEQGLADARVFPADRKDLVRRHRRLTKAPSVPDDDAKFLTHTIDGRPLNRATGEKSRFIGYDDEGCTVEELVLQHYKMDGWHGTHHEGSEFRSLLGLLLWDIIFLDNIPDVFQTPFQSRPLDMDSRYADHFYTARVTAIDAAVDSLRRSSRQELCARLAATWGAHEGTQCALVNWERITLKYMQLIALGMGGPALAALIQVWIKHLETSGLPDLLMVRVKWHGDAMEFVDEDTDCVDIAAWCAAPSDAFPIDVMVEQAVETQFVEVKGPRDRLSDTQIVWLDRLNAAGIAAVVCYVQEPELKKTQVATTKKRAKKASSDAATEGNRSSNEPKQDDGAKPVKRAKGLPPPHIPIEIFDY